MAKTVTSTVTTEEVVDDFSNVTDEQIEAEVPVEAPVVAVNKVDISSLLENFDLGKMIEDKIAEGIAKSNLNPSNPIVDATQRDKKAFVPQRYLKHYRCDVSPDMSVQQRVYDAASDTLISVVKGKRMQFRRGHFFATDQDQVDQIEWMMRHPGLDPTDPSRVIGGNPTIYEDDGKDLAQCAYCDELFVVGSNALRSHLRATHGVTV